MAATEKKELGANALKEHMVQDPGEEFVPIRLFRDNDKYKDDVFVAVNGESVQIKRGENVSVKRKFADVLAQSEMQDMATSRMMDQKSAEYEKEAASLRI